MAGNVFVLGLDDFVKHQLHKIPNADQYNFIPVLSVYEAAEAPTYDIDDMLDKAEEAIESHGGPVDAVVTCWDFPSTVIAFELRRKYNLPSSPLESVLRCEHKYWSRVIQERAAPDNVPGYQYFDPFADEPLSQLNLDYPFWIKPIKSHSSLLGFRITGAEDFNKAIPRIRDKIGRLAEPFNHFLDKAELPEQIADVDGYHCIAEAIISRGRQCTLEGYVQKGEVELYGVIDSVRHARYRSCFVRYEYPSELPESVTDRMEAIGEKVIREAELDNSPFNIEFYYDRERDHIWLLEINTRISRSHTPLFTLVDGVSHLKVMLDVAMGKTVEPPHRDGDFDVSGKFMVRVFEDGVVESVPGEKDIAAVKETFGDCTVEIEVEPGDRLSELENQDAYSYEIAVIFLGARNRRELVRKYEKCLDLLPFEFSSVENQKKRA